MFNHPASFPLYPTRIAAPLRPGWPGVPPPLSMAEGRIRADEAAETRTLSEAILRQGASAVAMVAAATLWRRQWRQAGYPQFCNLGRNVAPAEEWRIAGHSH